jgi:hypothetical protein
MQNDSCPFYPEDWDEISLFIKEAAGWVCGECGAQCRRPGEPHDSNTRILTVSHYFHDYTSPEVFCVALCSTCHLRHDAPYVWVARWRWERWRRLCAGQLSLLPQ